jgi:hypothetical protein
VSSVLAGPTCDSIDVIAEGIRLPELEIGDLLVGSLMGAYTMGSASEFNSIPRTKILVLNAPLTVAVRPDPFATRSSRETRQSHSVTAE